MFVQLVFLRKAKVMMPVGILLKDLKFLPKIAYEYTNTIHIVGHLVSLKISWAKPVSKENIVG